MKDTLITARRKKIELRTWLICFVIANACNLYAIIVYKTSFTELLTVFFMYYCLRARSMCYGRYCAFCFME